MRIRPRTRTVSNRGLTPAVTLFLCLLGACSGPERTPHQPIQGVDTPDNPVKNPYDAPPVPNQQPGQHPQPDAVPDAPRDSGGRGAAADALPPPAQQQPSFLDAFIGQVAGAYKASPGIVAIFPALSTKESSGSATVTKLGEDLMSWTTNRLEGAGVANVLASSELVNDIRASNRGLDFLRSKEDCYPLASRIGADYVIFGTVGRTVVNRLERDETLDVDWQCKRVADGITIARVDQNFRGAIATDLYRHYQLPGSWAIGSDAPPSRPDVDAEVRWTAAMLVRKIVERNPGLLAGKRVRIEPTEIRSLSGQRADLQAWASSFKRELNQREKKLASGGNADAESEALNSGPVTVHGKAYDTFATAMDDFATRYNAVQSTRAGELATDLSNVVAQSIREALGDKVNIVPDEAERHLMLSVIESEADAYRQDDAVDPATIAKLKAQGAEYLVRSALRPLLQNYQLQIFIYDLNRGTSVNESAPLDSLFKSALDSATQS